MNNTSAFKNFGRYLSYDLRRVWYNCGLSAVCVGILPLIGYLFCLMFHMVGISSALPTNAVTVSLVPVAIVLYVVIFPAKLYGEITNRRAGSNFLMLPASTGAKFASMLIMLLIVLPLATLLLFGLSDLLLSIVPSYGSSLISNAQVMSSLLRVDILGKGADASYNLWAAVTIEQFFNIVMFFALGAIIFKRKKAGKTILCYIAVIMAIVFILLLAAKSFLKDYEHMDLGMSEGTAAVILNVVLIAVGLLLGYFIYRRLKKIEL